jgi:hypothetical protein
MYVAIAHDSVPTASRSVAVLCKSLRHTARFLSSIASSPSSSGLSAVGCRLSAISLNPLILNPFQTSLLSSFFPTLARLACKSNHSRTYVPPQGWGSGPTNPPDDPYLPRPNFFSALRLSVLGVSAVSPSFFPRSPLATRHSFSEGGPICRLRRCSPLRDTGISAAAQCESAKKRLRHDQPHR